MPNLPLRTCLAALAAVLLACSSNSPSSGDGAPSPTDAGASCPRDLPAACPSPAPSYARDVAPIVEAKCLKCHAPGGVEGATHDLSTYAGIYAQRSAVLNQVYACAMPPAGEAGLTEAERASVLGWLVCKAPAN